MFGSRCVKTVLFTLGLLSLLASPAAAEKWTVGEGGITTIQAAVTAALADADTDDVIQIPPGVYAETVVVTYGASGQESMTIRRKGKSGQVTIEGASGTALRLNGASSMLVENLTLRSTGAGDGIPALLIDGGSSDITVQNLQGVAGDDVGLTIDGSTTVGVSATDCDFSGMVFVGFQIEGVGHTLKNCVADACGLNAFLLTDESLLCTLIKCRADAAGLTGGTFSGVCSVDGSNHVFEKMKISNGGNDGFYVQGRGHVFQKCQSNGNVDKGFDIDNSQARLESCSATGNLDGFSGGGLGTTISGGTFDGNTGHGVMVLDGGVEIDGVTANGNGGDGILIDAAVFGMKITDCLLKGNTGEGLRVQGQICWVEGNLAKGGDGLVDEGTGNDGRDNKVKSAGTNDF